MTTVLGIDIGGTRSRARISADGRTVAEAEADSASLTAAGPATATASLSGLLAALPADVSRPFDAICVGTAGNSVLGTGEFLRQRLAPLARTATVVIVDDATLVLAAAGLDDGIAVVSGTGSKAVGSYRGQRAQAGGWGYLLGDEGSGYWVVRAAIRELLDRGDRSAPSGELGTALLEATGAVGVDALHRQFFDHPQSRHWARLAPVVLDSGDPAVVRIIGGAAEALAGLAVTVAERLDAPPGLPVALAGGLLRHQALAPAVISAVQAARPGAKVVTPTEPPVAGAVRLAEAAARQVVA